MDFFIEPFLSLLFFFFFLFFASHFFNQWAFKSWVTGFSLDLGSDTIMKFYSWPNPNF